MGKWVFFSAKKEKKKQEKKNEKAMGKWEASTASRGAPPPHQGKCRGRATFLLPLLTWLVLVSISLLAFRSSLMYPRCKVHAPRRSGLRTAAQAELSPSQTAADSSQDAPSPPQEQRDVLPPEGKDVPAGEHRKLQPKHEVKESELQGLVREDAGSSGGGVSTAGASGGARQLQHQPGARGSKETALEGENHEKHSNLEPKAASEGASRGPRQRKGEAAVPAQDAGAANAGAADTGAADAGPAGDTPEGGSSMAGAAGEGTAGQAPGKDGGPAPSAPGGPATQEREPPPCSYQRPEVPRLAPWMPLPGKYFLAWCHLYGSSNRLYCHEKAAVLAAVLNRTLIVPSMDACAARPGDNSMQLMIDVGHMRRCLMRGNLGIKEEALQAAVEGGGFGNELEALVKLAAEHGTGLFAVSLEEYLRLRKVPKLEVDMLMCQGTEWWGSCPNGKCTAAGYVEFPPAMPSPEFLYTSEVPLTMARLMVIAAATAHAGVVSFGDSFYGNLDGYLLNEKVSMAPGFGIPCENLFQPTQNVFDLSEAFRRDVLNGTKYAALHFRRKDFATYCSEWSGRCVFWSVGEAAECVGSHMLDNGLTKLFVASDASGDELQMLQSLLLAFSIELYMFTPRTRVPVFESALVEKVVCAHAALFIHQARSTFSYHILQLRDGLGTASCLDQQLCSGRKKGFLVQMEQRDHSNPFEVKLIPDGLGLQAASFWKRLASRLPGPRPQL